LVGRRCRRERAYAEGDGESGRAEHGDADAVAVKHGFLLEISLMQGT
jgi:hypothetical protein